jgi:phosphoadenosine phosphosulfate reductase
MHPEPKESLVDLHIDKKIEFSEGIVSEAIERFGVNHMAIAITGGKDSTTNLWIFKRVCQELGVRLPVCMFIDEGDMFEEIQEFIEFLQKTWQLQVDYVINQDVISQVQNLGDMISTAALDEGNQLALREMGFTETEFPFIPDSTVCNHLMKTVPMRGYLVQHHIQALSTAIRWDEQVAREAEQYLSSRTNPDHIRVHPLLHFRERDIWIAIFKYDIPYNKLYKQGYRSLGARCASVRTSDIPAWMQDLENIPEREGRGEEKEKVMDQLRALGYM